ncbi:hypothetical protein EGI32_08550 [Ferruginibacter sp. HRS2-29]|nr:hypothetical protein [Ferruginibacter sp. HRS2-29]
MLKIIWVFILQILIINAKAQSSNFLFDSLHVVAIPEIKNDSIYLNVVIKNNSSCEVLIPGRNSFFVKNLSNQFYFDANASKYVLRLGLNNRHSGMPREFLVNLVSLPPNSELTLETSKIKAYPILFKLDFFFDYIFKKGINPDILNVNDKKFSMNGNDYVSECKMISIY